MHDKNSQHLTWSLLLMTGLCVGVLVCVYLLVGRSDRISRQAVNESSDKAGYSAPDNTAFAGASGLYSELFDLELTDMMAPLPMEGVEPAGQRTEE